MKKIAAIATAAALALGASACSSDADRVSKNLSVAAEQFEIERRITFINGITDEYLLVIEGRCSIEDSDRRLDVTCKTGAGDEADQYKKHYLGLSDNVTFISEQLDPAPADEYRYRVIFKPEAIVPNIDLETSGDN